MLKNLKENLNTYEPSARLFLSSLSPPPPADTPILITHVSLGFMLIEVNVNVQGLSHTKSTGPWLY